MSLGSKGGEKKKMNQMVVLLTGWYCRSGLQYIFLNRWYSEQRMTGKFRVVRVVS